MTKTTITYPMSSLDLLDNVINPARAKDREMNGANRFNGELRPRDFLNRVVDELDLELPDAKVSRLALPQGGYNETHYFDLNKDQCLLVGMRESKIVRKIVLDRLNELEGFVESAKKSEDKELSGRAAILAGARDMLSELSIALEKEMEVSEEKSMSTYPISDVVGRCVAKEANKFLEENGYIDRHFHNGKAAGWSLTEKGAEYGVNVSSKKAKNNQLQWRTAIRDILPSPRELKEMYA